MKEFAKEFYKSKAWKRCRTGYISQRRAVDGGLCEVCHNKLGYIVHHKIPLTPMNINDSLISLNYDNLRYECKVCHDREEVHEFVREKKCRCSFGADGQPLPPCK